MVPIREIVLRFFWRWALVLGGILATVGALLQQFWSVALALIGVGVICYGGSILRLSAVQPEDRHKFAVAKLTGSLEWLSADQIRLRAVLSIIGGAALLLLALSQVATDAVTLVIVNDSGKPLFVSYRYAHVQAERRDNSTVVASGKLLEPGFKRSASMPFVMNRRPTDDAMDLRVEAWDTTHLVFCETVTVPERGFGLVVEVRIVSGIQNCTPP
jgi:hypothetical protein